MPFAQPASAPTPPSIWGAGIPLSPEEMACVRAVRRLGNLRSEAKDELTRIQLLCVCREPEDMRRLVRYSMKEAWHEDQQARSADPRHTPGLFVRKARDGWQATVRRYARDHGLECKAEVRAVDNNRHGDYDLYFSPKDDPFLKWVAAGGRYGAGEAELMALCRKKEADAEAPGNAQEDMLLENAGPVAKDLAVEEVVAEDVPMEASGSEDIVVMEQDATWRTPSSQEDTAELPQDTAEPASIAPESPTEEIGMQPAMVAEAAMQDAAEASGQGAHHVPAQPPARHIGGNAAAVKSNRNMPPVARHRAATDAAGHTAGPDAAPPSRPRRSPKQHHIVLDIASGMAAFAASVPQGYWDRQGLPVRLVPD